jgi:hypothetical protein
MVFFEVAGRQVQAIRNIDYFLLQSNDKGRIAKKEWEKGMRLVWNSYVIHPSRTLSKHLWIVKNGEIMIKLTQKDWNDGND